jgi:nicotinate-nucleotide--dimethylbenzimidazole phosphoribosyltransferase
LEETSIRIAGITANPMPKLEKKAVLVMAGDHGVVAEGVSAYPQDVTSQMVMNFLHGGAAINVFARQAGARVIVVDMGVAAELPAAPGLIIHKIAKGTGNLARGAAMSQIQATLSMLTGAKVIEAEAAVGLDLLAVGDMGIGNTTASAAIAAALTGRPPEDFVGRGTGVDDAGLHRKIEAVRRGLDVNRPKMNDGTDILAKVGGFEIGGLAGAMLAAAGRRIPILVDGFISTAAAMIAVNQGPAVREYLFAGHASPEGGHRIMLEWLGLQPLLDLDMRLGEGTGAVLAMHLVEAACLALAEMATFGEAGVSEKSE